MKIKKPSILARNHCLLFYLLSELPFVQFPRLINLKDPNHLANLPYSCGGDKSCIVFMHLVATELQHEGIQ